MSVSTKTHRIDPLRVAIAVTAAAVIAAMWWAVYVLVASDRDHTVESVRLANTNLARAFEEHTARSIDYVDRLALELKLQYERSGTAFELAKFYGEGGVNTELVRNALITDEKGDVVLASTLPAPKVNLADREHVRVHVERDTGRPFISKPILARVNKQTSIIVTRRLNHPDGTFAGVVGVAINPSYFSTVYRQVDMGEHGIVALVGRDDGIIRAHSEAGTDADAIGSDVRGGGVFTALAKAPHGTVMSRSPRDGIVRIVSYRSLASYPLVVNVGMAEDAALRDVRARERDRRITASIGTLATLGTALWLLVLVTRQRRGEARAEALRLERARDEERANVLLRERDARYRGVVEASTDGFLLGDLSGRVVDVNDAYVKRSGFSREELLGMRLADIDPRLGGAELAALAARTAKGGGEIFESTHRARDGAPWPVEVSVTYVAEAGGRLMAFVRDITERQRAAAAIAASEERLRQAVAASDIGIFDLDRTTGELYCSPELRALLGLDAQAPLAVSDLLRCVVEDDRRAVADADADAIATDGSMVAELRVRRADGEVRTVAFRSETSFAGSGAERRPRRTVGAVLDVTEQKRITEARLQSQKLEALGTLAGGIAHDFNNLLQGIIANARFAQSDGEARPETRDSMRDVVSAGEHAAALVKRILAFARPDNEPQRAVELATVLNDALRLLRSALPASIVFKTQVAAGVPAIVADASQLHEAIVNLATNSADAIGQRAGTIEFTLEPVVVDEATCHTIAGLRPGLHARLAVRDDGGGIDASIMERIFDAFFTTKGVGQGTGLGLSMVHGIVRAHHGAITVESSAGAGATFVIYFPAAAAHVVASAPAVERPRSRLRSLRLLYIDDEERLVTLAERVLARAGHSVTGFSQPAAAIDAFRRHPEAFDAVVSDLTMPDESGFDVARAVRSLRADVPIVIATGFVREEDEAHAKSLGVHALLHKPFRLEELEEVLATALPSAVRTSIPPPS